jgi:UPF0755 protein
VASLIEEEAKFHEDRPQVARVIYNRLSHGIALGIDATSCYDKGETPCQLTAADLQIDSPYNTRRSKNLPPTPISSPGRASIQAALQPADGDWTYYVRNDAEGHHLFTASDTEFQNAKNECEAQGWGCG